MRMDKLTSKFQLALADAQSLAVGRDHQFIEPVHMMAALMDQDGGNRTEIRSGNCLLPTFSPDGKKIVYTPGEDRKIWIGSLETGQSMELETGLPSDMGYFSVSWSPDGRRIAFNGRRTAREVEFWLISDFLPEEVER